MLIDPERSQVLIIDLQSKLVPVLTNGDDLIHHVCRLIATAHLLGIPVTLVEENPEGLGATVAEVKIAAAGAPVFSKMAFGAAADPPTLLHMMDLKMHGRDHVVLAGAEAHVCVLQSALGLMAAGFTVGVVVDAISARRAFDRDTAVARLAAAGVRLLTSEMIAFEWLQTAANPAFKAVLDLVR